MATPRPPPGGHGFESRSYALFHRVCVDPVVSRTHCEIPPCVYRPQTHPRAYNNFCDTLCVDGLYSKRRSLSKVSAGGPLDTVLFFSWNTFLLIAFGVTAIAILDGVPFQQRNTPVPVQHTYPVGTFCCQASVTLDSRVVPNQFPAFMPVGVGLLATPPCRPPLRLYHKQNPYPLSFSGACLYGVNLQGRCLALHDLSYSNLATADLRNADLMLANLDHANLGGCLLEGVAVGLDNFCGA